MNKFMYCSKCGKVYLRTVVEDIEEETRAVKTCCGYRIGGDC